MATAGSAEGGAAEGSTGVRTAGGVPAHLADKPVLLMSKLGFASMQLFHEALEPLGLHPRHLALLNLLDAEDGRSQQALGEVLHIDPSTMVAVIDDLEREGLAERRRNPDDRRAYTVHLTAQGRSQLTRGRRAAKKVEDQVLAPLDPAERGRLLELLRRLALAGHLPRFGPPGRSGDCAPPR